MNPARWLKLIDFPQVAIFLGPAIVVLGFTMLASRFYVSSFEIHEHIKRVTNRDDAWETVFHDIQIDSSKIETICKLMDDNERKTGVILAKQDEILKRQEELVVMLQAKKLGELHIGTRNLNSLIGGCQDACSQELQARAR